MQQRYYDPGLGVFLPVDPVTAYLNSINQFHRCRYADSNPYTLGVPDGRLSGVAGSMRDLGQGDAVKQVLRPEPASLSSVMVSWVRPSHSQCLHLPQGAHLGSQACLLRVAHWFGRRSCPCSLTTPVGVSFVAIVRSTMNPEHTRLGIDRWAGVLRNWAAGIERVQQRVGDDFTT